MKLCDSHTSERWRAKPARQSVSATLHQEGQHSKLGHRQFQSAPFESNFEFALINSESTHFQNFLARAGASRRSRV